MMDDVTGAGGSTDPRVAARIRALLAKAEATEFAAEAEAFTAKAQAMMAEYSIDVALSDTAASTAPGSLRIAHDAPYAGQKATLLGAVAAPNGCRTVWHARSRTSTVFGFDNDLAAVEVLFTSLLVQAAIAMRGAERDDPFAGERLRSFRSSFLLGYASRVGERLRAVRADAERRAATQEGGGPLVPVLAARDDRIEAAIRDAYGPLRARRITYRNAGGFAAGHVAGGRADLGGRAARLREAG